MTTRIRPASRIAAVVHETARGFHEAGLIDARDMAEYDALCLMPAPAAYNARRIKALRRRIGIAPERLAQLLNVEPRTVRQWEDGRTRPRGSALRLLELLERKGPEALLPEPQRRPDGRAPRARRAG